MDKVIERFRRDPVNTVSSMDQQAITALIGHLSDHYYNRGSSLVSDELFDYLQGFQKQSTIGHPVKKKARLPFYMGSLDKIKPGNGSLDTWLQTFPGPYVLSFKLDGVSGLLDKRGDRLCLYTRGDGKFGQDISHLIPFLRIAGSINDGECVRGELIISKENFKKISQKMSNARNGVAGILNTKTPDPAMLSLIDFIAYSVLSPNLAVPDQNTWLQQRGFVIPFYRIERRLTLELLSRELVVARIRSPFNIDGIVVSDGSTAYPHPTASNPRHAFAFKQVLTDQMAETTVLDVLWDVSKDRYLKPRVRVKTVSLLGSEISFATAHNAKYIYDHRIGPGSRILLIKSGDVIPYIKEILKPSDSGFPKMPDCVYTWTGSKTDIVSTDKDDARVTVKKLVYFFKTLGIKHWAESTIEKFVTAGYDDVFKILGACEPRLPGIGEKTLARLQESLEEGLRDRELHEIMAASQVFGRGIAIKKLKILTESVPDLLERSFPLPKIHGFEEKTMIQIMENLQGFRSFLSRLLEAKPDLLIKQESGRGNLEGKPMIVLTGFRDPKLESIFHISDRVSRGVSLVVAKDPGVPSTKIKKARELGIPVVSRDEFFSSGGV